MGKIFPSKKHGIANSRHNRTPLPLVVMKSILNSSSHGYRYSYIYLYFAKKPQQRFENSCCDWLCTGAPKRIRTSGTQFRKLLLYPPELWAHADYNYVYHHTMYKAARQFSIPFSVL